MKTTTLRMWPCVCTAAMLALQLSIDEQAHAQPGPPAPEFRVDPTWPTVPNNWVLGEVTSISVDRNDDIWVLHVPQSIPEDKRANAAPPVLKFDAAGKLLTSWGGPGNGAAWLGREHGIFVDANDFVWIGGRAGWPRATTPGVSDDMIMKFTMTGELVMQIGRSGQSTGNLDTENVHQATDVFVDTEAREVYAADGYGNKRVIVFDSETGKFKRMWGAFGNPPPPTFAPNAPAPQAQTTPEGPPEFGLPHAIKVSRDGVVYLADRINNRIQMFTREGKFLKQVRVTNEGSTVVPVPAGFAFSPDRNQQFLYVVDSGPMRVVIFDRQSMTQIGVVGMKGANAGEFDIVHHMAVDSKGNLYTAEIVNNRRAQKFVLAARREAIGARLRACRAPRSISVPVIKVTDLAYGRLQSPSLDEAEEFLTAFGLVRTERTRDALYMRGTDAPHHVHVTHLGPSRFMGLGFFAASEDDLEKLARAPGASGIEHVDEPGGGKRVTLADPLGYRVEVVCGMQSLEPLAAAEQSMNTGANKLRRAGELLRVERRPSRVKRIAHAVLMTRNVTDKVRWYREMLGFLPSDEVYEGSKDNIVASFNRCDRGEAFVDHHTFLCFESPTTGLNHLSFEVQSFDDLMVGHEHLRQAGKYRHVWGVGRHLLGSQIFDYWEDPWRRVHEHWTDSDVLNARAKAGLHPIEIGFSAQWGTPPPEDFVNHAIP